MGNEPDLSLERDIIKKMHLTNEERLGAEKFLEAIQGLPKADEYSDCEGLTELPVATNKGIDDLQIAAMMDNVDQYLDTYFIVGYDLKGSRFSCMKSATQMAMDALIINTSTELEGLREMVHASGMVFNTDNEPEDLGDEH
jgi:hypothetical protein